jgi:hypothetical protein
VRHKGDPNSEPETRKYLVEDWREFMHSMISTLLGDGANSGRYAYDQLHPKLVAFESGQAVEFFRFDLPPGHRLSAPDAGHPCDKLMIDENDRVFELQGSQMAGFPYARQGHPRLV